MMANERNFYRIVIPHSMFYSDIILPIPLYIKGDISGTATKLDISWIKTGQISTYRPLYMLNPTPEDLVYITLLNIKYIKCDTETTSQLNNYTNWS